MEHTLLNVYEWRWLRSYTNTLCLSKMLPPLFALAEKPRTAVTAANAKVICESLFFPDLEVKNVLFVVTPA